MPVPDDSQGLIKHSMADSDKYTLADRLEQYCDQYNHVCRQCPMHNRVPVEDYCPVGDIRRQMQIELEDWHAL